MNHYRCIVIESTGNYVPYSGLSFEAASHALSLYGEVNTVLVQQKEYDGLGWRTIMGVWRHV